MCCVIHNTFDHHTGECTLFRDKTGVDKWLTVVEKRQNKAPVYIGQDTPLTIIAQSGMPLAMLPDNTGPWSPQFTIDVVSLKLEQFEHKPWFRNQRVNEGRGFHDLKTNEGRMHLHNITKWGRNRFLGPKLQTCRILRRHMASTIRARYDF